MNPPPLRLERTLWPALALLVLVVVLCQATNMDLAVQDRLYDFAERRWLLPREGVMKFIFHSVPHYLYVGGLAVLLILLWRKKLPGVTGRRMAVFMLTCGLTPALIGTMKKSIGSHCPYSVERYGGAEPYTRPLSHHDTCCRTRKPGACWPAGHASGGFALVSLASLARTRRGQRRGILTGLLCGWITGGYQMLKGAHYLSDTLVTMLLAWIIHLLLRLLLMKKEPPPAFPNHTVTA